MMAPGVQVYGLREGQVNAVEIGGHTISIAADELRLTTQGPISGNEAEQIYQQLAGIKRAHGKVYVLIDACCGMTLDSTMRRHVTQLRNLTAPTAVAIFGASLPQQAMLVLLNSALQLVRGTRVPLRVSNSEAEALAWLRSQRAATTAKK